MSIKNLGGPQGNQPYDTFHVSRGTCSNPNFSSFISDNDSNLTEHKQQPRNKEHMKRVIVFIKHHGSVEMNNNPIQSIYHSVYSSTIKKIQ